MKLEEAKMLVEKASRIEQILSCRDGAKSLSSELSLADGSCETYVSRVNVVFIVRDDENESDIRTILGEKEAEKLRKFMIELLAERIKECDQELEQL